MKRRPTEATAWVRSRGNPRPAKPDKAPEKRATHGAPFSALARLAAIGPSGEPWITRANGKRARARTTIPLGPASVGREVLVCFADDGRTPVVVGLLVDPGDGRVEQDAACLDVRLDRRRIVLSAQEEVVISCGKASIKLSPDGKVVVQGTDVVSSASRVNRIRGGAVKVN